jgi:hypothetical protein
MPAVAGLKESDFSYTLLYTIDFIPMSKVRMV